MLSDKQRRVLVAIVQTYRAGARHFYLAPGGEELWLYYDDTSAPLRSGVMTTAFDLEHLAKEGLINAFRVRGSYTFWQTLAFGRRFGIGLELTQRGLTLIEDQATNQQPVKGDERPYVITFIHGTWGRDSRWFSEGSKLRERLIARFGNRVQFNTVRWSGRNSHAARVGAIADLRRNLACLDDGTVHPPHLVIAHSHGGTVAFYALREADVRARLSGVICLNTPFLAVLRRNVRPLTTVVMLVSALVGFYGLLSAMTHSMNAFGNARGWLQAMKHAPWWVHVCTSSVVAILWFGLFRLCMWVVYDYVPRVAAIMNQRLVEFREAAREQIILPKVNMPVLCIKTSGDEVVGAVNAVTTAANAPLAALHPWVRFCYMLSSLLAITPVMCRAW